MDRIKLIKMLFQKFGFQTYLEIGSRHGHSLFPVPARRKVAIDPAFRINPIVRLVWILRDWRNARIQYFAKESERFFQENRAQLTAIGSIDVSLVDGLHTFRVALRDILDSAEVLSRHGWIIVHDCLPPTVASAFPSPAFPSELEASQIPGWTGEWCGDVWKAIVYLREHHSDLFEAFVVDCDYGLGVVRLKQPVTRRIEIGEERVSAIDARTFEQLIGNREHWLGLMTVEELDMYVNAPK